MKLARMLHLSKLASVNLSVLAGLLLALNFVSFLGLATWRSFRSGRLVVNQPGWGEERWRLPTYDGQADRARLVFQEFNSLASRYEPFLGWSRLPFQGRTTTINREGDRDHRALPRLGEPVGTVRFFGGSTMWGTGVEDQGTIPALFNEMFPQYEVYNHGETSFNSRQALERLISLFSQGGRADIVIFLDGVNDVDTQCLSPFAPPTHGREQQMREVMQRASDLDRPTQEILEGAYALFLHWTALATRAVGWRLLGSGINGESGPSTGPRTCATDASKAELVAKVMVNNWEIANLITESRRGVFLGLLQPNAHVGSPNILHLQGTLREDLGRNYRATYPVVQELIRERDVPWMKDISSALDGEAAVLIDDAHVAKEGNQMLAARIRDVLVENGWIESP